MNHIYNDFTSCYYELLDDVYNNPEFICSPRGQKIKEKIAVKFQIKNPRARVPFIKERKFAINYMIAEALWYFSGIEKSDWISYYSKFWDKISEDGLANSAYGARIFKPHARCAQRVMFECDDSYDWNDSLDLDKVKFSVDPSDTWTQWQYVIDKLSQDPDSRQAVIHIRTANDSRYAKLDVPCTLSLQFLIRNDKLELIVAMRSNDCLLGLGNDVPAFTFFQELMAIELSNKLKRKIGLGTYTHISNSLHIYERNFQQVEEILNNRVERQITNISMPDMPKEPPLEMLLMFESELRKLDDTNKILEHCNSFCDIVMHPYWQDWVKILTSYRFSKLNDRTNQQNLIQSTSWNGYHFFER